MNTTLKNPTALSAATRATALAASFLTSTVLLGATLVGITGGVPDANSATAIRQAAAQRHEVAAPSPVRAAASDETTITTMETIGASPREI